jgi:hypothetical protein
MAEDLLLLLHLLLSLLVFAVILSAAKDLEELNSPRTIGYFNPFAVVFACPLPPEPKNVISTEAAHGLIVSSAVEKSASLPVVSAHCRAIVLVVALASTSWA